MCSFKHIWVGIALPNIHNEGPVSTQVGLYSEKKIDDQSFMESTKNANWIGTMWLQNTLWTYSHMYVFRSHPAHMFVRVHFNVAWPTKLVLLVPLKLLTFGSPQDVNIKRRKKLMESKILFSGVNGCSTLAHWCVQQISVDSANVVVFL